MYDIWNHKTHRRHPLSQSFNSIGDAWDYVRKFLNTEDYEINPVGYKPSKKPVGRPRLNLPTKPRHFLQVERNPQFDAAIFEVRKHLANGQGVSVDEISLSRAVRFATVFFATNFKDES